MSAPSWLPGFVSWVIAALLGVGLIAEVGSRIWMGRTKGVDAVEEQGDKAADRLIALYEKQIEELVSERTTLKRKVEALESDVGDLKSLVSGIIRQIKESEDCEIARECPSRIVPGERRIPESFKPAKA